MTKFGILISYINDNFVNFVVQRGIVNKKACFLFPGQGAQYPGMGLDFLQWTQENSPESEIIRLFSLAKEVMGMDMAEVLANSSPDHLKRTDVSQPAITLANLSSALFLKERGIEPLACAGFSLGEYTALVLGGVISLEDCIFLVNERGKAMQGAIDSISSGGGEAPGMAAVVGLNPEQVDTIISTRDWELYGANYNSQRQVVVSGTSAALKEAEAVFKEAGARRYIILPVAGPYHSPFMKAAADAFASSLEKVAFKDPLIPLFSNVTGGQISSGAEAKALALRQIVESVKWTEVEGAIQKLSPPMIIEAGPGKVLQGLWKDTEDPTPCLAGGTLQDCLEITQQ